MSSKWGEQISFWDLITLTNDKKVSAAVKEKDNFILYRPLLSDVLDACEFLSGQAYLQYKKI